MVIKGQCDSKPICIIPRIFYLNKKYKYIRSGRIHISIKDGLDVLFGCFDCITLPKIMILGRVVSHKDEPRKEPSFFLFIDQYQLHEQKCPHAADGEPYLFLM